MTTQNATVAMGEPRNLIDGKLVDSSSGATFDNINPATEEVIGVCADSTLDDMSRAVGAARRAFDETDWSTNAALRKKCILQLCDAMQEAKEELRQVVVAEAGSPLLLTYAVQVDTYIDQMPYWAELADEFVYEHEMATVEFMGQPQRKAHVSRSHGGGRRHHTVELPALSEPRQGRAGARLGLYGSAQAGDGHAVERDDSRATDRREDRHAAGCLQRRYQLGSRRGRGALHRPSRRPADVHRLHAGGSPRHGAGLVDGEESVPRARRKVGEPSSSTI